MKCEIFKVKKMWIMVFWIVMPHGTVVGYQHFGGMYHLCLQLVSFLKSHWYNGIKWNTESILNDQFPLKVPAWQTGSDMLPSLF
jgi:hypothetical protein